MRMNGKTMKKLRLPKSSSYSYLLVIALVLAMTPLFATAATVPVDARVDSFQPGDITINTGDTVIWTASSVSSGFHTVTGDPTGTANGGPGSPDSTCQETLNGLLLTVGSTYSYTFTIPGLC